MSDINKTILLGRLGVDPVLRSTKSGIPVTTFSIATEVYHKETKESETTWHRIVTWGRPAQLCSEELKKGMPVFLEGRMKVRKYEGADGKMNYMHEVHANNIKFLHRRSKSNTPENISTELEMPAEEALN